MHEVAEYLGDEARTVLAVYAHVLGEGQRRDHLQRLASAEQTALERGHPGDTHRIDAHGGDAATPRRTAPKLALHSQEPAIGDTRGTLGNNLAGETEQALPRDFEERPDHSRRRWDLNPRNPKRVLHLSRVVH